MRSFDGFRRVLAVFGSTFLFALFSCSQAPAPEKRSEPEAKAQEAKVPEPRPATGSYLKVEPKSPADLYREINDDDPHAAVEESPSVTVNGVRFSATIEKKWAFRHDGATIPTAQGEAPFEYPVEIQFRIFNDTEQDLIFPTFDTYGIEIVGPKKRPVFPSGGRDWTTFTRPILVLSKSGYTIHCRTRLVFRKGANELLYRDDTGTYQTFGPIVRGSYFVAVHYSNGGGTSAFAAPKEIQGTAVWSGNAKTPPITVEVVER